MYLTAWAIRARVEALRIPQFAHHCDLGGELRRLVEEASIDPTAVEQT